jgi:hypothetical protein
MGVPAAAAHAMLLAPASATTHERPCRCLELHLEAARVDLERAAQRHHAAHEVRQLAHIAGPVLRLQPIQKLGMQPRCRERSCAHTSREVLASTECLRGGRAAAAA